MLDLQDNRNCHNINFVSPSHFVPQILEALNMAISEGLKIPLIYNSNGYDEVDTLKQLDGVIDIYLPDLKYASDENAKRYSGIKDYVATARTAVKEMYNQVGLLKMDSKEVAVSGLIIRHLVLPNDISGTKECLHWISRELSSEVTISLMAQYFPSNMANKFPEINRPLETDEYDEALKTLKELGFFNALYQETRAAHIYKPNFNNQEDPFFDQ
jgi:putative pyruvate formate lyase activating enzyme